MGTEVLRPQDLLAERFRVSPASFQRRRNFSGNGSLTNLIVNRKPNNTGYKKTSPKPDKKKFNTVTETKKPTSAESRRKDDVTNSGLVTGQVTLLRRGESLDSLTSKVKGGNPKANSSPNEKPVDNLAICGTGRIGPDSPEMVPKQIRLQVPTDGYAGSAFSLSPSPRSVPLPSFFKKHHGECEVKSFDDSATRDLRRLLRLD